MVLPEILFAVLSNPETKPWTKFQTKPKHNQSQTEPSWAKSAKPSRAETSRAESSRAETSRAETKWPDPTRPDPSQGELNQAIWVY